jgi:hypothetical protein
MFRISIVFLYIALGSNFLMFFDVLIQILSGLTFA